MSERPECPLVIDRLPALVSDDLPTGERELVEAHLEACGDCAAERDAFAEVLDAIEPAADPAGFQLARATLGQRIDEEQGRRRQTRGRVLALRAAVASAAAVLLAGLAITVPPDVNLSGLSQASRSVSSYLASPPIRFAGLGGVFTSFFSDPGDQR